MREGPGLILLWPESTGCPIVRSMDSTPVLPATHSTPGHSEREAALKQTLAAALRYLADLETRRVSPLPEAQSALSALSRELTQGPTSAGDVVRMLDEYGSPATMGM